MSGAETFLLPIFTGMFANILTDLASLKNSPDDNQTAREITQEILDGISYDFEWTGDEKLEEICLFLQEKEVNNIGLQIFCVVVYERLRGKKSLEVSSKLSEELFLLFRKNFSVCLTQIVKDF